MSIPVSSPVTYGLSRALPTLSYEEAVPRVRAALAAQGFGVLTEIDVKATMKAKLGEEVRPMVILGACNPPVALQALQLEPGVGLLMPCNVVVSADDDGGCVVSAIDPGALFGVVGREGMEPLVEKVRAMLQAALDGIDA